MRYAADHKARTRAAVLTEASKALRKDGPHRVSVAAIMKRAGLTHGGFYAHFKSREALLVATIGTMFDASRERWQKTLAGKTPSEGLATYIDWYLSKPHRDGREAGCAVAALASDLPRLSAPCQKAYGKGTRDKIGELAAVLAALGTPAPERLATSVFAELVGALSLARIEASPKRSDQILATTRANLKQRLGL